MRVASPFGDNREFQILERSQRNRAGLPVDACTGAAPAYARHGDARTKEACREGACDEACREQTRGKEACCDETGSAKAAG